MWYAASGRLMQERALLVGCVQVVDVPEGDWFCPHCLEECVPAPKRSDFVAN
jgi:hypothetical protein